MKVLVASLTALFMLAGTVSGSAQALPQWPQFLNGPSHNSYAPDSAINTSNASSFGVKWMSHIYSTDLGSPVVAYNTTLGKAVVYVGDERGDLFALDATTGQQIWGTNFGIGDSERDTPAVGPDGAVWLGTNFNATMYKVNGANGQVLCSIKSPNGHAIQGSPMIVSPPGKSAMVYWDAIDSGTQGPLVATNEATCATVFDNQVIAGSWTTPSFAVNGAGEPLTIIGTADPGCSEIAYDANTGAVVWTKFLALFNPCKADVGNAGSISPPGVNGFTNGVDYVADDDGTEYALDLNTGNAIWEYASYPQGFNGKLYQIASMALGGNSVVYGYYNGINSLNAKTGALNWAWTAPAGVDSSPAIIGPIGSEVVAGADITGMFRLFSLASGSQLYNYQTGGYIVASPAEYNGTVYITSANGYVYAFGPGGGNAAPPTETISSPSNGQQLANPANGSIAISGTATDASGVVAVEIAIQESGTSGQWYNAATNSWGTAPVPIQATLSSPGAATTNWSFSLPVPASGNNYAIFVNAQNAAHISDNGSSSVFSVSTSSNEPTVRTSAYDVVPGGSFTSSGNAFKPGETATFTLLGATVATATVGSTGNVPQTAIGVPSDANFGVTSLTVTGNSSGKSATAQIYISNAWSQAGYSPLRTAEEPNDYVINHTIFAGPSVVNENWMYPTGAAINTTPAVKDGIAYIGNDAGILTAVTVASGAKAWSYTVPSGQPIRSSPAIDAKNNIIFGANDGLLHVLNSAGAATTTVTLSGNLGAPAYANGNIVIGSSTGQIWSIADPAWTTNWSAAAGSAISVPVAYDAPQGLVVVGTANGSIIAYSSSTGALKWTATTGGTINGLSIAGTQVFAGSADGHVYGYTERTGTLNWTITADGSPITALDANGHGPAFGTANGNLYDANSKGSIYYTRQMATSRVVGMGGAGTDEFAAYAAGDLAMLRAADGSWFYSSGGEYTVAPIVMNGIIFEGAQNGNLVSFVPQNYQVPPQVSTLIGNTVVVVDGTGCTNSENR